MAPLTEILVPSFVQMLRGLAAWLDKAVAHEEEAGRLPDELMALRLAPDMYPLSAQIRFVCFQAQEPVWRLTGRPLPEPLLAVREEGWSANDRPGSLAAARARIEEALASLQEIGPETLDDGADVGITLDLPNGIIFDMNGLQYARDWALPQFYFHLSTAYGILRNHGVDLGKADFVAHMFAYIRPGTFPGA